MNDNIIEPVKQNDTIDYETAMNMLLKSLEKSEVFQLRRHITKTVVGAMVLLFVMEIFMMGHIITLTKNTTAINENVNSLQTMVMKVEQDVEEVQPPVVESIPAPIVVENQEPATVESTINDIEEYYKAMTDLLLRQECTEEWFVEYKALIDEYKDTVDIPEQIYDVYPELEITTLCHCVEAEAHGGSFASKVNVANVILNRVNDPDAWEDTISGVIMSPGQFTTTKPTITQATKLACEYAFLFPDTTDGAEYFNRGGPSDPANKSYTWIMEDDIGHNFYRKGNKIIVDTNLIDDDAVG